jgi:putative transposase
VDGPANASPDDPHDQLLDASLLPSQPLIAKVLRRPIESAQYTSMACRATCQRLGLRQSMGRTGSCLDNAAAESFFATLKVELVGRRRYRTRAEARASIFAWIAWYNRRRLHSTNGYLSPVEWEHRHATLSPRPSTIAA